jgi:benzoyl-CoA reductase/2-hydroxyglutaryl-CoA dehydratase subunit BcrC/BadD/HgdB
VAETTCDGKKKMYELMGLTRPTYVLELPQKPADSDAMVHWVRELHKLKAKLEEHFGVEVTDDKIRQATRTMNRERRLRRQLASLMKAPSPPLSGCSILSSHPAGSSFAWTIARGSSPFSMTLTNKPKTRFSLWLRSIFVCHARL